MPPAEPAPSADDDLASAVAQCLARPDVLDALAAIYASADDELAALSPRCWGGGACCRFDIADHRLYVTTIELAYLTLAGPPPSPVRVGRCPYQLGPRCMARANRPLGCRIYFCDKSLGDGPADIYQQKHEGICRLHSQSGLPYHYVELTAALVENGDNFFAQKRL